MPDIGQNLSQQQMLDASQMYPQSTFDPQSNFDLSVPNFYPTNPLPQLDRQMVFGAAYAGMDPSVNVNTGLGDNFNMWDNFDMNGLGFTGNNNSWLSQSSTAWFMPFNMEPPQTGDIDNSLLMGDFSVGNSFSGPSGQQAQHQAMQNTSNMNLDLAEEGQQNG